MDMTGLEAGVTVRIRALYLPNLFDVPTIDIDIVFDRFYVPVQLGSFSNARSLVCHDTRMFIEITLVVYVQHIGILLLWSDCVWILPRLHAAGRKVVAAHQT